LPLSSREAPAGHLYRQAAGYANPKEIAMAKREPLPQLTRDNFVNFEAGLGLGADNMQSSAQYIAQQHTRNRTMLENAYRSSWIVGKIVNTIADDLTRAGIDMQIPSEEGAAGKIMKAMRRRQVWGKLNSAIRWSRLYGGAIAVMLIDGQNLSTPLRLDTIGPEQFKGLLVIDRWFLNPSFDLVPDLDSPNFNKPISYTILPGTGIAFSNETIHHTRVLRFEGPELPLMQKQQEMGWGMSVVEQLYDRMVAFDSATAGAANLLHKAHLRTLSVENLRALIANGGKTYEALIANIQMIRRLQSSEGFTLLDAKDKLETQTYAFSGLDNVLMQFGQQVSGATDIPLVKLFGQSPAGMSATGESDVRNYYDKIAQSQELYLRDPLTRLAEVIYPSVMHKPLPDDFDFAFVSLWQMSEQEKSTIAKTSTEAVMSVQATGLISDKMVLQELQAIGRRTGIWGSISNQDVEAAEDEPPGPPESAAFTEPGQEGQPGEDDDPPAPGAAKKPKPNEQE
jgi:phage-related protein (TIGR01555 family)